MDLFVGDQVLARTDRMVALGGRRPFLEAEVADVNGQKRRIEVFARAIFTVKIRVSIDGRSLNKRYL